MDILKPDLYSIDNKDSFMKGDNPLNGLQLHTVYCIHITYSYVESEKSSFKCSSVFI